MRVGFVIGSEDHRRRLDEFLWSAFPAVSRMHLRELVRDGLCEVNGREVNRGVILRAGDYVEIEIEAGSRSSLQPEPLPLDVIFEDEEVVAVSKPSGMLVHPTIRVRGGTLLNAVAHHLGGNASVRTGLVHRLDKDTSGIVLIAKNPRSHRILARHFQQKLVSKRYLAIVEGRPLADSGEIEAPIGRIAAERIWLVKDDGKPALSRYRVRGSAGGRSLLELEPVTGRTNQLRIHLAHIGLPILGDTKYGGARFGRLCLHAWKLDFRHPSDGRPVALEAPEPTEFAALIEKIGRSGE